MSNGSECGRGGENPKNIWWNDVVKAAVSFFSLFLELVSVIPAVAGSDCCLINLFGYNLIVRGRRELTPRRDKNET